MNHDDYSAAQHGDGISHPKKGVRTKYYRLLIRNKSTAAMKVQLQAESKRDAVRYAKARWPGAIVEAIN